MVAEVPKTLAQKALDADLVQNKNERKPNKKNRYPMIFVGGLGVSTTSDDLMEAFESEGFSITIYPKIRTGKSFSYCPTVALATIEQVENIISIGKLWVKDRFVEIREYKTRSKEKVVNDPRGKKQKQKRREHINREHYRRRELSSRQRSRHDLRLSHNYDVPRNYHQPPNFHPFLAPSPIPILAPSPNPMMMAPSPFMPVAPSPDMFVHMPSSEMIPMAPSSDMLLPIDPSNMICPMAPSPLMPMAPSPNMILPMMGPSPNMAPSPMLPLFAPSPIPMLHDGTGSQCNTPIPVLVKMRGNEIVSVEPVHSSQCMAEQ